MTKAEKVKSIATGWRNTVWKSPEVEAEAIRRVKICSECKSNHNNICMQCKCWIPAKARSMVEHCPISKWNE